MGWFFNREPEPEESDPVPVRLASDEFISGLIELAEMYERREKASRVSVVTLAEALSKKVHFNSGDLDRAISEIRGALLSSFDYGAVASEIRSFIQDYKYRGRRPPYMRPQTEEPQRDGE